MNILIDRSPDRRDDPIAVAFADVARIPDDFTPIEDLTREQIIDVAYAIRNALRKAHERSKAHDEFMSAELGRIADGLRSPHAP